MKSNSISKSTTEPSPFLILLALVLLVAIQSEAVAGFGDPYKLNAEISFNFDVREYQISPDGRYVVYLENDNSGGMHTLYSVPSRGGAAMKMNGDVPINGDT